MTSNQTKCEIAAELLGYERIVWDGERYVGYGSSDPADRSKDDPEGYYLADTDAELANLIERAR